MNTFASKTGLRPLPKRRTAPKISSRSSAIAPLVFFAGFFLSTVAESTTRIVGHYTGNDIVKSGIISDSIIVMLTAIVLAITLFWGKPRDEKSSLGIALIFMLILLWSCNAIFASPAMTSWNTPIEEISRSGIFFAVYIIYLQSQPEHGNTKLVEILLFFVIIASSYLLIITIFQSLGIIDNFYFQWYRNEQVPRPAGGMSHPHYYSFISGLSIISSILLYKNRNISRFSSIILSTIFLAGIFISTSRAGMIFGVITYAICMRDILQFRVSQYVVFSFFSLIFLSILSYCLYMLGVRVPVLENLADITIDGLMNDKGVLRGRQIYWFDEVDYILDSMKSILVGYGYQPNVSHNLYLRELQVKGVLGSAIYFYILYIIYYKCKSIASPNYSTALLALIMQLIVASTTIPILVSVAVNFLTILLFYSIALLSSNGNADAVKKAPPFAARDARLVRR